MGLTKTEIEALQDQSLRDLANPDSEQFAERSVNWGSVESRIKRAEFLESQSAKVSKRNIRVIKAYSK